jgi:hypothetical protein
MKRNKGIILLLISILITIIGSVFKIMEAYSVSDVFLGIGVIMFFVSIGMLVYQLFKPA